MVLFIPESFEEHLHLDKKRHYIIHMNASVLTTYFPYWDRLQAIRTSKLWNAQVRACMRVCFRACVRALCIRLASSTLVVATVCVCFLPFRVDITGVVSLLCQFYVCSCWVDATVLTLSTSPRVFFSRFFFQGEITVLYIRLRL